MRADRLLALMFALQSSGRATAQELAARLEVTERTIYRDVAALSTAGIPIYTQSGTNGGIYLDEHYRISFTGLSIPEIQALFVSSDAGPLADLGLAKAAEMSVLKLFAALPALHKHEVERLRQRFYVDSVKWFEFSQAPSILPLIQQAVWEDLQVNMTYQNYEGQVTSCLINAYSLVSKANVWYLIGYKNEDKPRTYRVSRIQTFELTHTHFKRDPQFDLAGYWKKMSQHFETERIQRFPFYPALIRVKPSAAVFLQNYVVDRFEKRETDDGNGWLVAQVNFLSFDEARMCVLGLGTDVQVVEPLELHEAVVATARAIVVFHDSQFRSEELMPTERIL